MPRPATGRKPYYVRLLPKTVEEQRKPDESDADVIRRLVAAGITHNARCQPR